MVQITLQQVSRHLTKDIIDKVFKAKTKSEDEIEDIVITRGAPAGEGLISAVYRIHVKGKKHAATFIAKGLVSDMLLRKTLNCVSFFAREATFFTKILPAFSKIQTSLGAKERIQDYVPICYGCHHDGNYDFIILEDLSTSLYTPLLTTPTRNDRDLALKTLAHFHSVSFALRLKDPKEFNRITNYVDEFYYEEVNKAWYTKYLDKAIDIFKRVVDELEDPKSVYYKKFDDIAKSDVFGQIVDLISEPGDHVVLNHGDAWIPNFMFTSKKAIVIDFQLLRCGSPAFDLSFFTLLCSNVCHTVEDFWEAIKVYYSALQYYLDDMGIDSDEVFSFKTLQDELRKFGRFGFLGALSTIPLMASERCDVMKTFHIEDSSVERIPLEVLWNLAPIEKEDQKVCLINALHVAVDAGLI